MMLANAEGFSKHLDAGCTHYTDAAFRLKELMKERIPMMSVEERESLWSPVSSLFTMMTPYAIEANRYRMSLPQAATMRLSCRSLFCWSLNARCLTW